MADQVSITSPVSIESDSKERVAFDLACKIDYYSSLKAENKDKRYWLSLFRQCRKAVYGKTLEQILQED
ncbi:MAG: hypothetical protein PHH28_06250 [Desulfuromonadaceae bacterium]|nr:hypothetical protein [Desulfuromonadaceae bacterium]